MSRFHHLSGIARLTVLSIATTGCATTVGPGRLGVLWRASGGTQPLADWTQLDSGGALILDVREPAELNTGGDAIKGALNIPLSQLRGRLPEVPGDRDVWIICGAGQRAYSRNA